MGSFKVIPAMDLMDGRCVRLVQGDYERKTVYENDPVELAKTFLDAGLDWLHVVDLDGAQSGKPENLSTVEAIANTGIHVELGGGLRRKEHFLLAINSGVDVLILGSLLVGAGRKELKEWSADFPGVLAAGIDARNGFVSVHGWKATTNIRAVDLIKIVEKSGFNRVIYTDINRDGTLSGPNLEELKKIVEHTSLPVIASGGISGVEDIWAVKEYASHGVSGVIVGKAFYDGKITLEELSQC
ncbi:MAG: 1-(5-phosphoribosyl)-5-[(5-phosphoribosylamino)methylideneamino]imidazole-4-carboxamide isomerase [Candidatus Marinimicrobia bacterium]|nr:1-(5-phosphoribosyl)-5-[(5-phosphoribosylamino)methylideneamino]imidazole-4-carboxamide isomerase [Candidatus Neomarinimicrobiota bacterium]